MAESPLAVYQAHLDKGELAYQWSPKAARAVFYPRVVCPYSGSTELEWRVASGLGTVYATTVTYPFKGDGYNIVLVDTVEGFRMMAHGDKNLAIGDKVIARFERFTGRVVPYFAKAK